MKSSLQTLTRIQKFKIDEQRKILAEFQSQEDHLLEQLHALAQELEHEKEFSRGQGAAADFGAYVKRNLDRRRQYEDQLAAVRQKMEEVRDLIADMFKEQKTYEIVDQKRIEQENREQSAKDQKMLDEIGTNTYIKRKQS